MIVGKGEDLTELLIPPPPHLALLPSQFENLVRDFVFHRATRTFTYEYS